MKKLVHVALVDMTPEEIVEWETRQPSLDRLKRDLTEDVMAERERRIDGGFTFRGVRYQTRATDRENIAGAHQLALAAMIVNGAAAGDLFWAGNTDPETGDPAPFVWIAEDNTLNPMDAPTTVAFGQAAAAHKSACIFHAYRLKQQVGAAEESGIGSTDITTGWPA